MLINDVLTLINVLGNKIYSDYIDVYYNEAFYVIHQVK